MHRLGKRLRGGTNKPRPRSPSAGRCFRSSRKPGARQLQVQRKAAAGATSRHSAETGVRNTQPTQQACLGRVQQQTAGGAHGPEHRRPPEKEHRARQRLPPSGQGRGCLPQHLLQADGRAAAPMSGPGAVRNSKMPASARLLLSCHGRAASQPAHLASVGVHALCVRVHSCMARGGRRWWINGTGSQRVCPHLPTRQAAQQPAQAVHGEDTFQARA